MTMADPGDDTKVVLNKRSRVDQDECVPVSPPAKLPRVPNLVRADSVASSDSVNSVYDPPELNPEHVADVLGMFEVPDSVADPVVDSVVRSLQEEISVDPTAEIRSENELCYLLEASDDELGLPPRNSPPECSTAGEAFGFDGEVWVCDSSGLGIGGGGGGGGGGGTDFAALDALFDKESEGSKLTWQTESVSAL